MFNQTDLTEHRHSNKTTRLKHNALSSKANDPFHSCQTNGGPSGSSRCNGSPGLAGMCSRDGQGKKTGGRLEAAKEVKRGVLMLDLGSCCSLSEVENGFDARF